MSEISDMIQRLCPDGVEYRKIKEIAEVGTGSSDRKDAIEDGSYPFYVRSKDVLKKNSFEFDEEAIIIPGEGGIGEIFHYANGKYALHQRAYRIHFTTSIITKFAYYYFSNSFKAFIFQKAVNATVTSIRKPMIEDFEIPVPPLEVQRKIVEVLDNFSELTAELTAELEARKKQYEYYRDNLLNFSQIAPPNSVKWMKLGEIGDVKMCKRVMKHQTNTEYGIPFYKIGTFGKTADAFISQELFNELKNSYSYPKYGDILISASGTIGRTVVYNGEDAYYQDSNIVWIDNDESIALNSYLKIIYQVIEWKVEGGTIKRLYNDNIKNTVIPIPPLSEQERIVSILDRFEALTTDLTSGLPAEIKARQQQYEYYRDQLLTFKRAN